MAKPILLSHRWRKLWRSMWQGFQSHHHPDCINGPSIWDPSSHVQLLELEGALRLNRQPPAVHIIFFTSSTANAWSKGIYYPVITTNPTSNSSTLSIFVLGVTIFNWFLSRDQTMTTEHFEPIHKPTEALKPTEDLYQPERTHTIHLPRNFF